MSEGPVVVERDPNLTRCGFKVTTGSESGTTAGSRFGTIVASRIAGSLVPIEIAEARLLTVIE